ncbi:MAG TPA: tetratricopeptide repeat protein [Fluviicola sp.]|nr:tetratricopeptide repeat protein [Fluviicola sp.]
MKLVCITACLFMIFACGEKPQKKAKELSVDELYKKYPDSVPIIIQHGNAMINRYDFEKAMNDGAKAYRMQPSNLEARLLYANALNNRAERTVTDIQTAQTHFKFIVKKQPKNTKALVSLATTYAQLGDYDKAFQYTNEALRVDKHYRDAYILKGTIYLSMNKRDLAKSSYQTAIEQDPDFFEAYLKLGVIYQEEKNPVCIEYYTTATQIRPNSIDALYSLAYAYQELGETEKAKTIYHKMLKKDPSFVTSSFQLGYIKQFQENDIDSAMIYYKNTLQKEPRFVEAWHNLGVCSELKGEKYDAVKFYRKALDYNQDYELSKEALKRLSK